MKQNTKKMSWTDMLRLNNRALKLFYKRYPKMVIVRLLSVVWNALTPYGEIYLVALVIDELAGNKDVTRLKTLVLFTLAFGAVTALVAAFLNKGKEIYNAGDWLKVGNILAEKMFDMDYIHLDDPTTADLLSTIRQNMNGVGLGLPQVIESYEHLLSSLLTMVGGFGLSVSLFTIKVPSEAGGLAVLNHPLVIFGLIIVMVVITFISPLLYTKSQSYYAAYVDSYNMGNRLFNSFSSLGNHPEFATDVRIYRQDRIYEYYMLDKRSTFGSKGFFAQLARGPMGLYAAGAAAVSVVFTGVVYTFVCLKALAGAFGLGAVSQYVTSITKVSQGMAMFVSTIGTMHNNAPFLELTFKFLDIKNTMYQGSLTVEKRRDCKYEIEFCDVSFRYPGSQSEALTHVNMKFEIGKRLAVVGMNGSGKTTFIKLLCRLYDPTDGVILLNGIDIRKYNYREYMHIFSVVFQDFKLLSLKLGQNVATTEQYDREKVLQCLDQAGFSSQLNKMENGLDTFLYKDYQQSGILVSGGEAQKIAMARTLYKGASFIILDEPTSALDPLAEAEIYEKFDQMTKGKITIYISHRLSSCQFCDEIVVFHEGTVIQQGTHQTLLADKKGKYYELWHAQAQYYTEGNAFDSR